MRNLFDEVVSKLNASNCRLFQIVPESDHSVVVVPWHSQVDETYNTISGYGYNVEKEFQQGTWLLRVIRPESVFDHLREPFAVELSHIIYGAIRRQASYELSGEEGDAPYDELLTALENATQYVRYLKHHIHDYDEEDRCMTCGRDGRS